MSITLSQIIPGTWENNNLFGDKGLTLDQQLEISIQENPVLRTYGKEILINPYLKQLDPIVNDYELKLHNRSKIMENNDINEAFKNVYYFTQIQSNISVYLNHYRNKVSQFKFTIEMFTELIRQDLENKNALKINQLLTQKTKELELIEKNHQDRKLSTIESKFLTAKISGINEKYDTLIGQLTGMRSQQIINNQLKINQLINELKRKMMIVESISNYFELRFKNFQEEIMSGKKIIDNLSFLLKNTM